jgi:hypothetical protein
VHGILFRHVEKEEEQHGYECGLFSFDCCAELQCRASTFRNRTRRRYATGDEKKYNPLALWLDRMSSLLTVRGGQLVHHDTLTELHHANHRNWWNRIHRTSVGR